ncbi:XdhC/CoxI family protein [uncultured Croceitalea sp.]|uniref:XdhC family protein n=1 Tax=uncultured Croceitalea sp. TaxID=1798908 RepID=UPI0033056766
MTHELKKIIQAYITAKSEKIACVMATVVALEGSSYRRPGVRMLIHENGRMIGAVSGGCVEKEVQRQAESVFATKIPKVMTYDGRYRLGCEGILYILLEPFAPDTLFLEAFATTISQRTVLRIDSYYEKEYSESMAFGSVFYLKGALYELQPKREAASAISVFEQILPACFRLIIIGAEHDAVQLSSYAAMTGWEVTVVVNPREEKTLKDFPGASGFIAVEPESFQPQFDHRTAVILMTHSYVKDLQYLMALKDAEFAYLGLLGPLRRREKLFSELLERYPDISEAFLEKVHGPAGIHIGAETPQEIAISVMAEVLSVVNGTSPMLLKEKQGSIHS